MLRIALTGGIATGKSYVLARFAAYGIPTIDADQLVHEALRAGSPLVPVVVARFGRSVLAPDGSVNRSALGAVVFADANAREDLEAILHPHVYRLIDEWFASLQTDPAGLQRSGWAVAVADIPLLFETRHDRFFDRVVVAACPQDVQVARLKTRSGLTDEQARARLDAQWPIEEKRKRAHFVIDTSGTFEETDRQVDGVVERLRAQG